MTTMKRTSLPYRCGRPSSPPVCLLVHVVVIAALLLLASNDPALAFAPTTTLTTRHHNGHLAQWQRQPPPHQKHTMLYASKPSLFSNDVYETIAQGRIAVIPQFLKKDYDLTPFRTDAQQLWDQGHFATDALAGYGSSGNFDVRRDRAVLKLKQWKNPELGHYPTRLALGDLMGQVRQDLAWHLDRPGLVAKDSNSVNLYGSGSTEISYTRFGPGAFLKRHVDEHHEELKGRSAGWQQPTRRSLSWLLYLNSVDWNADQFGGQLRCFERQSLLPGQGTRIGAASNGDLQMGWWTATASDPVERPVYMASHQGTCQLYLLENGNNVAPTYISKEFTAHPWLYTGAAEALVQQFLLYPRYAQQKGRFQCLELPKNVLADVWKNDSAYKGQGLPPQRPQEQVRDVSPAGGTLVVFDSVTLPHEVLATRERTRWAASGWMHEDQQPHNAV